MKIQLTFDDGKTLTLTDVTAPRTVIKAVELKLEDVGNGDVIAVDLDHNALQALARSISVLS